MKVFLKRLSRFVLVLLITILLVILYWRIRPNRADIDPSLNIETWVAVADGMHNSNTDMILWNDHFYLIHASSPFHFASEECKLIVWRSKDAKKWEKTAEITNPGEDIRDPKFVVINDTLIAYVLRNTAFEAEPYDTYYTSTTDGANWHSIKEIGHGGWLFWRPKSLDGETWYLPAYWWQHGKSQLLKSEDGINWSVVGPIHESPTIPGDYNDETAIEFLPDGRMISTARIEVGQDLTGHKDGHTLISVSEPPYKHWKAVKSYTTRLDGPYLFSFGGKIFAVGRQHDENVFPSNTGSILSRYRTALYQVFEDRLVHLSDLPSAGDTSYAGVVIKDDYAYISYYTSPIKRDYPWIMGMLSESDILIAKVPLKRLLEKAE